MAEMVKVLMKILKMPVIPTRLSKEENSENRQAFLITENLVPISITLRGAMNFNIGTKDKPRFVNVLSVN